MSADYKPGTVAVIAADFGDQGFDNTRAFRIENGWATEYGEYHDRYVTEVRPLVVLDLDGFEAANVVTSLRELADEAEHRFHWDLSAAELSVIADQIEAQSRPPKPPEPQGLGAVVEDTEGVLWVRSSLDGEDNLGKPWKNGPVCKHWQIVDAVRVLSDGWEPKP